jgi:hypothetical protein
VGNGLIKKLVERAAAGEEIIIAKAGKPVSWFPMNRIINPGGSWKGKVWMADDFDELPGDIAAAFRGVNVHQADAE